MKFKYLSDGFSTHSQREVKKNKGFKALTEYEETKTAAAGLPANAAAQIELMQDHSGTASWRFAGNRHIITMGQESTLQLKPALRGDEKAIKALGHSLLSHECCHGLFSSRDLSGIVATLQSDKVPFRLFNLLEDARIEHGGRAKGIPFGWDGIGCQRDAAVTTPAGLFFAFVQSEASAEKDPSAHALKGVVWCGSRKLHDGRDVVPLVESFYLRACNTATSEEIAALTIEWVSVFGMDYSEVPVSVGVAVGPVTDKADEWVVSASPQQRPGTVNHPGWRSWQNFIESKKFTGMYLDRPQVDRIKNSMRALLNAQEQTPDTTGSEGTRLNIGGIMGGEPSEFWQVSKQRAEGKRRVLLVIDMSGSMQVFWRIGGGREFAMAMVELGQAGDIDLRVILSGHSSRAELPVQGLREVDILSLWPASGDSMEDTLRTQVGMEAISWATSVIVWTDGDLNSGQRVGHSLAQAGVRFLACSTCVDKRNAMLSHFPVVAVADDPTTVAAKVAEAILQGDADMIREEGL